jgi:N-acetyl-alpha-D-muramate 1-phosphate uridylyltransferase
MKAMILAAGRGERMYPLSEHVPKPMIAANGRPLIIHLIERLRRAGFVDLVINLAYLGEIIQRAVGDGAAFGVHIAYSREALALETAGGIAWALPLLGEAPFAVVNGDIYSDFELGRLKSAGAALLHHGSAAHLVLVDNPAHHAAGDFCLHGHKVREDGTERLTFSGIGVYAPSLFASVARGTRYQLASLLRPAMARGEVTGEHHRGMWMDVGTPERLAALERRLALTGAATTRTSAG